MRRILLPAILALSSLATSIGILAAGDVRHTHTLPAPVQLSRTLSRMEYTYQANFAATGAVPVLVVNLFSAHEVSTNLVGGVDVRSRGFLEVDVAVTRPEAFAALTRAGIPPASVTSAYDNLRWVDLTNLYFSVAYAKVTGVLSRVTGASP